MLCKKVWILSRATLLKKLQKSSSLSSLKQIWDTITAIVKRYYDQDTWKENLVFGQDGFELLQDILEDAGELKERTPYAELVNTEFAQNAS